MGCTMQEEVWFGVQKSLVSWGAHKDPKALSIKVIRGCMVYMSFKAGGLAAWLFRHQTLIPKPQSALIEPFYRTLSPKP